MDIFDMPVKITLVPYAVFPETPLPNALLAFFMREAVRVASLSARYQCAEVALDKTPASRKNPRRFPAWSRRNGCGPEGKRMRRW